MNNIYESGLGDELINPENYNDEIKSYLLVEAELIDELISIYDIIIEVGCMHGRLLKHVIGKSKKYIGIDNSKTYIQEGWSAFADFLNESAQLVNANCENLHTVQQIRSFKSSEKIVLIFPFNSFGNIEHISKAITSISKCKLPFYIFTYRYDEQATNVRLDYYAKSGFRNLIVNDSEVGIQVKDELGLNSIVYKDEWLSREFAKHNINLFAKNFGTIGKLFSNLNIINHG